MADDPNAAPPPAPDDPNAQLAAILKMLGPQQSYAPPAPVDRSTASLLGEALGGGTTGLSPADREAAGTRALLNFGANLSAASGYSTMPRTFGQVFAQGVGGAEQSLGGSEEVSAARLAAQQQYAEKEQELRINALREAIPLLQMQQLSAAKKALLGGDTNVAAPAPGSIGAPVLARDTSMTAGQQGNNPGNVSVTPGSPLPAGASAAIPVAGGKYVAAFPDVPTGVAAHSDTLNGYAASGTNTIRAAVTKWVGDPNVPKATMDSYVADVAKAAGVDPDATIDLTDPKVQRAFILAQQPHESGKAWLSPGDVDTGLALATARRQGRPGGPATAAAPQGAPVPAPTATAPPSKPGGPALPVPPVPPVITDQPAGGAQVAGPGAPTTARVGAVSPAVPGDVNAIIRGMTGAGADQTTLAPPGTAAPPIAPAPAVVAGPGVPAPAPKATAPPPVIPDRVPPSFTYTRQPLPPDIQQRIDNPVPPDQLKRLNDGISTAMTPEALQAAQNAKDTAIAKARTDAIAQGETWQQNNATLTKDVWQKQLDIQQANDLKQKDIDQANATAAATRQQEITLEGLKNRYVQINSQRDQVVKDDSAALTNYKTDAANATGIVQGLQMLRSVEADLPESGSTFFNNHKDMIGYFENNVGLPEAQMRTMTTRDLFQRVLTNLSTQMSQKAAVGPGTARNAEITQNTAALPDLASNHQGRLLAMGFIQNQAEDQIRRSSEAQDWYYSHPNPNKELDLNQSLYKFPETYQQNHPSIIPRAPQAGVTPNWLDANVRPGMVYERFEPQLVPLTKQPMLDANKRPIGKWVKDVRLDDQ